MHVSIESKDLRDLISAAAKAAGRDHLYTWLRLESQGEYLTATGQSPVAALTVASGEAVAGKAGSTAVDARLLARIASRLPDGEVVLRLDGDRLRVDAAGRTVYQLPVRDADDLPQPPSVDDGRTYRVEVGVLRRLLGATLPAASTDTTRPHLAGVLLHHDGTHLVAVATDGHRLHVARAASDGDDHLGDVLLPTEAVRLVLAQLAGASDADAAHMRRSPGGRVLVVECGGVLVVRLVDETFPPYQRIVPSETGTTITVDRQPLIEALQRIEQVADEHHMVLLAVRGGEPLHIAAEADGQEGHEHLHDVDLDGGDATIAISARYLLDALRACDAAAVCVCLRGRLEPVTVESEDDGVLTVIMPMRVDEAQVERLVGGV